VLHRIGAGDAPVEHRRKKARQLVDVGGCVRDVAVPSRLDGVIVGRVRVYRGRSSRSQHCLTLTEGAEVEQQHSLRWRRVRKGWLGTGLVQANVMQLVRYRVLELRGGAIRVHVEKY
jgi:hypothetical protein